MLRTIAAVIVGYIVMSVWVMLTLSVAWLVLGRNFAFEPGTTNVTAGWMTVAGLLGFFGAVLAGVVAARIGRDPTNTPVKVLAGVVLGLGIVFAAANNSASRPASDPADIPEGVSVFEAASHAQQPPWYGYFTAFIGAAGILFGGRLLRREEDDVDSAAR